MLEASLEEARGDVVVCYRNLERAGTGSKMEQKLHDRLMKAANVQKEKGAPLGVKKKKKKKKGSKLGRMQFR
jgi:hypothetical protein